MARIDEILLRDILHDGDFRETANGDLQTISGLQNLYQALFHRLITSPGTLIHRPEYGVGIKDFQNAPASLQNQTTLANRIREQFERESRIERITGFQFDVDDERPELTTITIKARIRGYGEIDLGFQPFGAV
jgi:phage baseplate assembly protein W